MIFYFGIAFVIAGIVALVIFLKKLSGEKTTAYIKNITLEYPTKDKAKRKQFPHAYISYHYQSIEYKAMVLLLSKKRRIGDQINVAFKASSPDKPTMYAPRQELTVVVILFALGIGVMVGSYFIVKSF